MKKIVIIGPESTGKTMLAGQLSDHYKCPKVDEYARAYIDQLDRPYHKDDLLEMARGQLAQEDNFQGSTEKYLFCDTDLRVIRIWSNFKYGDVHPWINYQISQRVYHAYLLLDVDLPWEPDPQREHPDQRQQIFDLYRAEMKTSGVPFSIISGVEKERLTSAINFIEHLS